MKINCGPTAATRTAKLKEWHDFFAIWPRRVGENDCRFLETIERKGEIYTAYIQHGLKVEMWAWEYRSKE